MAVAKDTADKALARKSSNRAPVRRAVGKSASEAVAKSASKQVRPAKPLPVTPPIETGEFLYYELPGRQTFSIDGSTLKGTGLQDLEAIVSDGNGALLSSNTRRLAVLVSPASHAEAFKKARVWMPMTDFRTNAYDTGRFALFLQEPIAVGTDGNADFLLLPRASAKWKRRTGVLRTSPPPPQPPAVQVVMPPVPDELIRTVAKQIGAEVGERIAASVDRLTSKIESFSQEAALAAVAPGARVC